MKNLYKASVEFSVDEDDDGNLSLTAESVGVALGEKNHKANVAELLAAYVYERFTSGALIVEVQERYQINFLSEVADGA